MSWKNGIGILQVIERRGLAAEAQPCGASVSLGYVPRAWLRLTVPRIPAEPRG